MVASLIFLIAAISGVSGSWNPLRIVQSATDDVYVPWAILSVVFAVAWSAFMGLMLLRPTRSWLTKQHANSYKAVLTHCCFATLKNVLFPLGLIAGLSVVINALQQVPFRETWIMLVNFGGFILFAMPLFIAYVLGAIAMNWAFVHNNLTDLQSPPASESTG